MGRKVGAEYVKDGSCQISVWAPFSACAEVVVKGDKRAISMEKDQEGYWVTSIRKVQPPLFYKIRLDQDAMYPDPASRSQPDGVHGWSEVQDSRGFEWEDQAWTGRPSGDMFIYEIHVGTFTEKGTFEAVIEKLDHLNQLGINTLEIMPIAQFPGDRNWGYDGVYPYAVQKSYGGQAGLKKLVNACHQKGFSVLLDVVYNHLGPEGNYLDKFGPYFTSKYHTPWGGALNFDDAHADQVRNFFIQNALMWLEEFHLDGLRLDAVHEIVDRGARHFLKELREEIDDLELRTGRQYVLIAESDLNDPRLVRNYNSGGYGLDAHWVDDFHHAVHTLLTDEHSGYYQDYGRIECLAKSFKQAYVYDGIYSKFRKKTVGSKPSGLPPSRFVTCIQNHDQVGNRLLGERMATLVPFEKQKLAAGVLLTAPFVPMLFMGEEFGETNAFRYFVSHGDPDLVRAVREGRKKEFEYFHQEEGSFSDPQARETFEQSRLNWNFRRNSEQEILFSFYKELLRLRKEGVFQPFGSQDLETTTSEEEKLLQVKASGKGYSLLGIYNFGKQPFRVNHPDVPKPEIILASADQKWGGPHEISPASGVVDVPGESLVICKIN